MEGYIYCVSNPMFDNIYKVGMTERDPITRINELYSTNIPLPYNLEFAKKVNNVRDVEKTIHTILEKYGKRININREFFEIDLNRIKSLFDFFDGIYYIEPLPIESPNPEPLVPYINCRDMTKCFYDGELIRHKTLLVDDIWIGKYNKNNNCIVYKEINYNSLSSFAGAHYLLIRPERTNSCNGWSECECYIENDKWISTNNLPLINYYP